MQNKYFIYIYFTLNLITCDGCKWMNNRCLPITEHLALLPWWRYMCLTYCNLWVFNFLLECDLYMDLIVGLLLILFLGVTEMSKTIRTRLTNCDIKLLSTDLSLQNKGGVLLQLLIHINICQNKLTSDIVNL